MRAIPLLLAASTFFSGCGDDGGSSPEPYPGDPFAVARAWCEYRATAASCDPSCTADRMNAPCDQSFSSPSFDEFIDCRNACPAVNHCADGATGYDCGCEEQCLRDLPREFVDAWAFDLDCTNAAVSASCRY
ncbi:MAG: hypothetical protein IT372_32430 [Polyangiaceae bacterium]|nr:hypothetical protein [Polyangiaceae bacterium]